MAKSETSFDYLFHVKELCRDICRRLPVFRHIDVDRVGFEVSKARNRDSFYGRWASVTPLRFEGGVRAALFRQKKIVRVGHTKNVIDETSQYYKAPEVVGLDGTELLYLFTIMTPRFYNLSVKDKVETVIHELLHIGPKFDGDYRHIPGRDKHHGNLKKYEEYCSQLAKEWLRLDPNPGLYNFLQWDYDALLEKFDSIELVKYPSIKYIPISKEEAIRLNPKLAQSGNNDNVQSSM